MYSVVPTATVGLHVNVVSLMQLQPNSASGSGALEHDAASLCTKCSPVSIVSAHSWLCLHT